MADIQKTVEIIFGGKNELSGTIGEIGQSFGQLDDITSRIAGPLAGIADSVIKTDAALAALAIGGMAYAIRESSEFNKSFALISTSITATGGDLAKYRDDVLSYSMTSVKSLADINASLYTAAQAGIAYTDSLAFIRRSEELSVANNANLNTTVDLLTGTMNAYGYSVKDVGHLNDVFFQSTLIGKQTIDELGQSLGGVVGIAANSGVGFEELNAAIAALTAKGLETPEAITAIKGVITAIISPSKEASDAAEKLGLNFSLSELKAKGFAGMLAEIRDKTGGSAEKMVTLFNEVRALNGALSLTGDGMKFFNKALDDINNSAGASEAAYQKMVNTFANQSQMVLNSAKVMMISIGTELEPMAAKVAGSFGDLFKGIKIGMDAGAFDPLFKYLDDVGGALAEWISEIAAAMPEALQKLDFSRLIAAFNDLGRAIGEYLGGLDLTKATDLASALQLIIDIITGLVRVTTGMADAFRPFAAVVVDFFKTLADGGPETQETIGKILAFAKAIQSAGLGVVAAIMAIDEFKISIRGLFDVLAGGSQIFWNGFEILVDAVMRGFLLMEGQLVAFVDTMTLGMFPGLKDLQAQIEAQTSAVTNSIIKNGMEAGQGLNRMSDGFVRLANETGTSRDKVAELRARLTEMPSRVETEVKMLNMEESTSKVEAIKRDIAELPDQREVGIKVLADGSTIENAWGMIIQRFPDGKVLLTNVGVEADEAKLSATQKKIDAAIPKDKQVEIQAKLDAEKIKGQADIIQKAIEWKAKLDIADVEANAKIIEAAFKSIDNTITSTGTTLSSILGVYAELMQSGSGGTSFIEQQVADENKRRDEALQLQKDLTKAEIENLKARTQSLQAGNALITIDGAGLQPHLEAFMFEILAAIQIRANAEGQKLLVGL